MGILWVHYATTAQRNTTLLQVKEFPQWNQGIYNYTTHNPRPNEIMMNRVILQAYFIAISHTCTQMHTYARAHTYTHTCTHCTHSLAWTTLDMEVGVTTLLAVLIMSVYLLMTANSCKSCFFLDSIASVVVMQLTQLVGNSNYTVTIATLYGEISSWTFSSIVGETGLANSTSSNCMLM